MRPFLPLIAGVLLCAGGALALPQQAQQPAKAHAAATARFAVPFIENDYGRALAAAKERNIPLFVDTWAPW